MTAAAWETVPGGAEWDALVAGLPGASVFQSSAWGEHRSESGWQVERWAARTGSAAVQLFVRRTMGVTLAWGPGAPLAGSARADPGALAALLDDLFAVLRVRHGRVYVRFDAPSDPSSPLSLALARSCSRPLAHLNSGMTVVLELTDDPVALFARMSKHHRYEVRRADPSSLEWTAGRDDEHVDALVGLHEEMTRRKRIPTAPQAHRDALISLCRRFGDGAIVLVGSAGGVPITACLVLTFAGRAFFHTAATGAAGLRRAASYAAVAEVALTLARRGVGELDLGGLDRSPAMAGVARFKEGFGGHVVRRTGEWHRGSLPGLTLAVDAALAVRRRSFGN